MNDEQRLLASAYLDGALTDEERARAEGDPDVVAEIERLDAVRAALRAVPAPDPARREAAVAAALSAYGEASAPSGATRRRPRWLAPATAAAALVVLVAGGVVALQRGGEDDSSDDAAPAATERATDLLELDEQAAEPTTTQAPPSVAAAPGRGTGTETATGATRSDAAAAESTIAAAADVIEVLSTPHELVAFASAHEESVPAPSSLTRCDAGTWVGTALYATASGEVVVEVFVDAGAVVAVDAATCEIVASARR